MKHTLWRLYYSHTKEEKWLNEMSAKGLMLTDYWWARYVFEEDDPGKYIYRLEFLDKHSKAVESRSYIKFMEETGAECVATYMHWVYFRRDAALGDFDTYTDLDSKIHKAKIIRNWWLCMGFFELFVGILQFVNMILNLVVEGYGAYILPEQIIAGCILLFIGLMFIFALAGPMHRQYKDMLKQKDIYDN